jgi:hypothetical protein
MIQPQPENLRQAERSVRCLPGVVCYCTQAAGEGEEVTVSSPEREVGKNT